MNGLAAEIEACLFDLDGALTQTAKVHAAAWKKMFDEGVQAYDGSVRYVKVVRDAGLHRNAHSAALEDALAGVEAGHRGDFGLVVGVDRVGQAQALREHGADIVVRDPTELPERA